MSALTRRSLLTGAATSVAVIAAAGPAAALTVSPSTYGAKRDGKTDDTAALQQAADAVAAAGGGTVQLDGGTYVCAGLRLKSYVRLVGGGTGVTILLAPVNSTAGAVVQSDAFATLTNQDRSSGGQTRFSLEQLTVDGNKANQAVSAAVQPPANVTFTQAGTGSRLPAGAYTVRVTAVTARGETDPGDTLFPAVVAGQTLTLGWSAVSGATGYRVYAVNSTDSRYLKLVATAGASATSVSFGALAPASAPYCPWRGSNSSALRGVTVYGYDFDVVDVEIRNSPGVGLYTEWSDSSSNSVSNPTNGPECRVSRVKVHGCSSHGIVSQGPHDSQYANVLSFFNAGNGRTDIGGTRGIWMADLGGSTHFVACHSYGAHDFAWQTDSDAYLTDCTGEGAMTAQLLAFGNNCQVIGGQFFQASHGGAATAVGIKVGNSRYATEQFTAVGVRLYNFDGTKGAALDLTQAGPTIKITAVIQQAAGDTFLNGVVPPGADLDVLSYGGCTRGPLRQSSAGHLMHGPVSFGAPTDVNPFIQVTVQPKDAYTKGLLVIAQPNQAADLFSVLDAGYATSFGIDNTGTPVLSKTATTATAGTAGAPPAQVATYLTVKVGTKTYRIPAYNA